MLQVLSDFSEHYKPAITPTFYHFDTSCRFFALKSSL